MGKITFMEIKGRTVGRILFLIIFFVFGLASSYGRAASIDMEPFRVGNSIIANGKQFALNLDGVRPDAPPCLTDPKADCDGDGVTNEKEKEDKTDPLDPCDLILAHQNCSPSSAWKKSDCDGDGVTNEKEKEDKTDPLDPCDLILAHQNCSPSLEWKKSDCDGDGVTNEKEKEDKTDPLDPCDLILAHQNCSPSSAWKKSDCDGDGVTNEKEKEDKTDPFDPCDLILAHQNCSPSLEWKKSDCDGDGVPNGKEKDDKTDPLDPCSYNPASITLPQGGAYLTADCDGDGVPNETEKEDGTDPLDPCEFVLAHQTVPTTVDWKELDCDGDGVPNDKEKEDGTDPMDPCSYNPESVTLPPSVEWESLDCDNDGNPNVTDPNPLVATARDDFGSTPAMTEVVIDILTNDDYLPNNDLTNLGVTSLAIIGGTAIGSVSMDADTGLLTYIPIASESNSSVTLVYEVCNTSPDPSVCASATVTIEIGANTLDAMDDDFSGTTDGGTIPGSNVMSNDTLNGVPVGPGDVVLTSVPTDELTINEDGSITITPGTPEGTYIIAYTICEVADPANCDSATVTVTVGPGSGTGGNTLDAVDDDFSGTTDGGTIPGSNVMSNDTLNGVPVGPGDVVLTSVPTDELTINPDGSINITPGIEEGTYTIEYTICEVADPANCDSATVSVVVEEGDGEEKIEVNQLVTPNGDGKNDFLFIRGVKNAKNNTLQIFNRWGVAVYKGNGYNNQNNIFDGRSKGRSTVAGSDYLPAGVYYYIFQYENKQRNITDSGYIYVSK